MTETFQTQYAKLTRTGPNEIEIRFTPGVVLNRNAIAEVIAERKRMCGDAPVGLLLIVPADTELDVAIISTDHLKVNQAAERILGFAVVANAVVSETLLRLYKAYYPTLFRSEVFTDEAEARVWLRARIAEALEVGKN